MSKIRIYISSTYEDLKECREAVHNALREALPMEFEIVCMEQYVAQDQRPLAKCLADVRSCLIYIGIFAMKYGFIPTDGNAEGKSITELEYREPCKRTNSSGRGIQVFPSLSSENNYSLDSRDYERDSAKLDRLNQLRNHIGHSHVTSFFRNKDHLASEVVKAIRALIGRCGGEEKLLEMQANLVARHTHVHSEQRISVDRLPDTSGQLFGR